VLFVLLLVNVNYVQGFEASSLATKPGKRPDVLRDAAVSSGGSIVTLRPEGHRLLEDEQELRGVPSGTTRFGKMYAPVTGYDTLYSQTGIEQAANKDLAGTDPALEVHNLIDLISGKQKKGATVELTVNSAAQQAGPGNALKTSGRENGGGGDQSADPARSSPSRPIPPSTRTCWPRWTARS